MRKSNITKQFILYCTVVLVFHTSCTFNNSESVKEKKEYTTATEEEKYDATKNHELPMESRQEKSTPTTTNEITISGNEIKYDSRAVKLNNKAMNNIKYSLNPVTHKDTLLLWEAVDLFDKAISIDSMYYMAYANKAMVLNRLSNSKEALFILGVITKLKPDYAEGFSSQGFIYEKMGLADSATTKYKSAIIAYSHRIKQTNDISDKINRAFILSLIDKEKGTQEIDYLIEDNPDDKTIMFWKLQLFDEFDREKFISKQ